MSYENIPKNADQSAVLVEVDKIVPVDVASLPDIPAQSFYVEVAKGNIPGHSIATLSGLNASVDATTSEDLWDLGGVLIWATSGEQWEIVSDESDDSSAGTGARAVQITYLDDQYVEHSEVVTLQGTSPALTVATNMYRALRATVVAVGATGHNVGTLVIKAAGGGNARIGIIPEVNRSLHGFYTIPAGKTGYLVYAHSAIGKNRDANLLIHNTAGDAGIFYRSIFSELYQNSVVLQPMAPIGAIEEKSDIKLVCSTENNNTSMSAYIQLLLVDNPAG